MICQYKALIMDIYGIVFKNPSYGDNLTMDNDFVDFAKKISPKYELILLSNDSPKQSKEITEKYGIDNFFSHKIISGAVNCNKPSLEIFDIALEKIGRKPAECIFVDCNIKSLLAAEEVGMATVLFNRGNDSFDGMTVCSFKELLDIIG